MSFQTSRSSYFLILGFYAAFSAVISSVTLAVNKWNVPVNAYNLNASRPLTILYSPFVNGTWTHLENNLALVVLLLFFGLFVMQFGFPGSVKNKSFVTLLCCGPILSGVLASFIMSRYQGISGAGTSVMNAALLGILMITLGFLGFSSLKGKKPALAFLALFGAGGLLYAFVIGFIYSGNGPVHTMGFIVGSMSSIFVNSQYPLSWEDRRKAKEHQESMS